MEYLFSTSRTSDNIPILGRYTKAVEMGISFKVANPTPQIKRILDLAGTERLIKIESAPIKKAAAY